FLQKLQTIGEDFCGLDVNTPLGGEDPMEGRPVITFETNLTAVAATSTGDFTVVFVGTKEGHLKKVGTRCSLSIRSTKRAEEVLERYPACFISPTL
ncbi:Plexin A3, partial [Dufourea novaeangliae]